MNERKPESRVRLYDDKLAFITALMQTPKFQHVTSLNAAVDMVLTDYILNHKVPIPAPAETAAIALPPAEVPKNAVLSKLRKPPKT